MTNQIQNNQIKFNLKGEVFTYTFTNNTVTVQYQDGGKGQGSKEFGLKNIMGAAQQGASFDSVSMANLHQIDQMTAVNVLVASSLS